MSNNMRRRGFASPAANSPSLVLALAIAMASGLLLAVSSDVIAVQSQGAVVVLVHHYTSAEVDSHGIRWPKERPGEAEKKLQKCLERELLGQKSILHVVSLDRFVSIVYPGL